MLIETEEDEGTTPNPVVIINCAPIFEKKLVEYGKANLQTRHNGTYKKHNEKLGKLLYMFSYRSSSTSIRIFIVCQDTMVRKPGKLQSHKIKDLCLMLNCSSPCTNPLSQLH